MLVIKSNSDAYKKPMTIHEQNKIDLTLNASEFSIL